MRLLEWFDALLLATAQKFCDKFQQFTGLTKFRLEKWSLILSLASIWWAVLTIDVSIVFLFLVIPISLICTMSVLRLIRAVELEEVEFLKNGHLIAFPSRFLPFRLLTVCVFGGMGIYNLLFFGRTGQALFFQQLSIVASVYFSACVPRPPGRSKAREWYEKALTWLDGKLAMPPEPAM